MSKCSELFDNNTIQLCSIVYIFQSSFTYIISLHLKITSRTDLIIISPLQMNKPGDSNLPKITQKQ